MKKSNIIIGLIIGMCVLFVGGYYGVEFVMEENVSNNDKVVNNQNSQQQSKSVLNSDSSNNLDLGVLTEEEFQSAIEVGKRYKGKSTQIENVNIITKQNDNSETEKIISCLITTPYKMVVDISKNLTEKYTSVDNNSFKNEYLQEKERYDLNLNTYRCIVNLVGKYDNFVKYTNIVLRVYGKNKTQVLQPIKVNNSLPSEKYNFGNGYYNSILGIFNAKDIEKLNPQQLEIIIIYPEGKEAKQIFDYDKLNQL